MYDVKFFAFEEMLNTSVRTTKNHPKEWYEVENILRLCEYLDDVRLKFKAPIKINSGYRNTIVNTAVGGSPNSYHLKGLAADITSLDKSGSANLRLFSIIKTKGDFDQLIAYHIKPNDIRSPIKFIHIGLSDKKNRLEVFHL